MAFAKTGCVGVLATIALGLVVLFLWPYRLETVEGLISKNGTGCDVRARNYGPSTPGVMAENVSYPLKILVFSDTCAGSPNGRPYTAELVSAASGHVVAKGLDCSDVGYVGPHACRLEIPPINSLLGSDQFLIRIVAARGDTAKSAELRLTLQRSWRSVVWDVMMSV